GHFYPLPAQDNFQLSVLLHLTMTIVRSCNTVTIYNFYNFFTQIELFFGGI
ncbi:unnamed protein product, partial [Staurois parvus]